MKSPRGFESLGFSHFFEGTPFPWSG